MPGTFIVVEGLDGAGKSTQLELLANYLSANGHDVVLTHEPGGTILGEQVRELVKQERDTALCGHAQMLLFAASFAQKYQEVIKPALASGKTVLCDRWFYSTIAYQSSHGIDDNLIRQVCLQATETALPDCVLFFDLSNKERNRRLASRGGTDVIEMLGADYFSQVRKAFLEMVESGEVTLINSDGSPADIHKAVIKAIIDVV